MLALKNGLIYENRELIYYRDGTPKHAGVIQDGKDIYYISFGGKAIKGQHSIHGEMGNGILRRGTYTFGEDYKLVVGSYIAPPKKKARRKPSAPRKRIRKKENSREISKKRKGKLRIAAMLALALIAAVWAAERGVIRSPAEQKPSVSVSPNVKITLPEFTEDVLLCSRAAKLEYDGAVSLETAVEAGAPYRPFYFEYYLVNCTGVLFLGEKEDFSDACQYTLEESKRYVAIDNLKVDTTYHYKVVAENREFFGSFHTASATRFVQIPGLVNTRDIGGGVTLDGKMVKQGLLIRGVELDGLVNAPYFIPEDELQNVQDQFGFVYDLDLRAPTIYIGNYSSRLGVAHRFYNVPMYGGIFADGNQAAIKQVFSDLADPRKYPMYLHCTWGTDRTGTIIFLLQGVLNMSKEDMKREYLLTGYVNPSLLEVDNMDVIISGLKPYKGDTLQEKIITFLTTEIGVTEEEIASIRSIFLEE